MSAASLNAYLAERQADPAIRLFAATTAAMRADPAWLAREDDPASALFLAEEEPVALSPAAFEATLAEIEAAEARDRAAAPEGGDPILAELARLPSPLRETALDALKAEHWRVGGIGIRRLPLAGRGETHLELMRIEPGCGAASHAHGGDELTLVLSGGYADGHGHYGPGDVSLAQGDFTHAPKADPGEPCYVLAVTYGEPRFFGLIGFLQRLGLFRAPVRG
ncbi:cupin domain-containing protein [Phenylobacterium montanum]|uniref:Cupin domain-containing protein n=1 Tax=Phenylobacterium montanum TaxID=2823693 RepID=A0A975FX92_9CAUL|nr:cupin domain-containing protein [Caulobacter sp. S6]QUD86980.1 cupin domain-containing protein [Caulobacter sp. S6]